MGLSLSEQSAEIGTDIINSLEQQKEKQITSIDNVETTEHMLQQSMRTLRGMTWSGWVYNMFNNEGKLQPASSNNRSGGDKRNQNRTSELCRGNISEGSGLESISQDTSSPNESNNKIKSQRQDQEIDNLSKSVAKLQDISMAIGETLVEHDEITDSLVNKTSDTNDYALTVTLRASQLAQRSTGSKAVLVGEYKFKTFHNNYLSVFDDTITLTPQFNRSTVFRVYVKENHLFGLQNMKTHKFLGLNLWGYVVATSTGFGKNQEIHVDLSGEKTGILFLKSNWGSGGWLKPDKDGFLRTVTTSLLDRDDRLLLTPLEITEADKKKLKNL